MKIKIKKDCEIPLGKGWCFLRSGYDKELIKQINEGKEVKVDKIHPLARNLVKQIKKKD
tara:strand:- start:687 stop:863 length:177 start_codon:yes stop_codon:yes gene_type:complete